ncbi:MAG: Phytanoyl-CoA dioxygenase (PhyH) [candidate division BRC1 bacterium ADurb.BinA292]|nr:MAG: Phytanoyl-CoA dioxygenase (PhyH) [candidate division BRC1 bacterium ADurb.BinA292]
MKLSPAARSFFRYQGFLRLPIVLEADVVTHLRETIQRHIREEIEPYRRDGHGRIVRISNVWDRDPIFQETFTRPDLLDCLADLLGPNIEFMKNRHNHATLRLRGETGDNDRPLLHRDALQWSRTIVSVVFYLEETTLENGCTHVVPGTQLLPITTSASMDVEAGEYDAQLLEQLAPLPMPRGGIAVIDGMLIHGVGVNRTESSRMSMTAGYHSVDEMVNEAPGHREVVRGSRFYLGNA